jgi:ABC-2 type transport system ATP-binding protein
VALINQGRIVACDTPENLKTTSMPGALLEIECEKVMEGLEVLREMPQVSDVTLYGIFLHAMVKDEKVSGEIASKLKEKGIPVRRTERITPSLEDVFVFLVESGRKNE